MVLTTNHNKSVTFYGRLIVREDVAFFAALSHERKQQYQGHNSVVIITDIPSICKILHIVQSNFHIMTSCIFSSTFEEGNIPFKNKNMPLSHYYAVLKQQN